MVQCWNIECPYNQKMICGCPIPIRLDRKGTCIFRRMPREQLLLFTDREISEDKFVELAKKHGVIE